MPKGGKFDRCVKKVAKKSGKDTAYAVCNSQAKKSGWKTKKGK